jgi:hypothetical protein
LSVDKVRQSWFDSVISNLSLNQLITENARVAESSCSLIDHIYTNRDMNYKDSNVLKVSLSDHYLIYTVRKLGNRRTKGRFRIDYTDYSLLTSSNVFNYFGNIDWSDILSSSSVDKMFSKFYHRFNLTVSPLLKYRSRFVKSKVLPPWFDNEIQKNINIRDKLKCSGNWENYKFQT